MEEHHGKRGGNEKRYQYCTDSSGAILYLRALQGHSGRNLIDPSLQDSVVVPNGLFKNIYHVGCAINSHSIINSGLIPEGQNLNNRQTIFFLPVNPMDKNHRDPDTIDLNAPRHAQYLHKAWKRHQNTVYWVDINLALKKGLKFFQTRSNAIILHETLPPCCIPKVVGMESGEILHGKVYVSPRPPPNISFKDHWMKELGSENAQRLEGQVVQQSRSSQSNQPIPNSSRVAKSHDRTGQLVVKTDKSEHTRITQDGRKTSRSQEIDTCSFHEEAVKTQTRSSDDSKSLNVEMAHDRTGQPVVNHDEFSHEQTMLNEVNIDFRIPGLPHSVVKQVESSRVRELVQKIENHPDRHALQQDLRQNKAYNPISAESKRMIQDVGNVELFEMIETDPRRSAKHAYHTGVKASSIAHAGISYKKQWPIDVSLYKRWTFFQFQNT